MVWQAAPLMMLELATYSPSSTSMSVKARKKISQGLEALDDPGHSRMKTVQMLIKANRTTYAILLRGKMKGNT